MNLHLPQTSPRLAYVGVGDELLDGRVADGHGPWLAGVLRGTPARLISCRLVGDDEDHIVRALTQAREEADLVVVSGGLGPTADDLTREAAARLAGQPLVRDPALVEPLRQRFAARGRPFTDNNLRQCAAPANAVVLRNEVGTAPGFALLGSPASGAAPILFFPGVPSEFRWFVERHVLPALPGSQRATRRAELELFGMGESELETRLDGLEALAAEVGGRVGYRAHFPTLALKLAAQDDRGLARLRFFVEERVGPGIVAEAPQTFLERLGQRLVARGAMVACAESCTGGGVAAALTRTSGSSAWFGLGWVAYANEAKEQMLGVEPRVLARHGAVSAQAVCQMALGALERAGADFALATSGIAGPGGATATKPVGTVHIALAIRGEAGLQVLHRLELWPGRPREQVRALAVHTPLALLLWLLEDRLPTGATSGPFSLADVFSTRGLPFDRARRRQNLAPVAPGLL